MRSTTIDVDTVFQAYVDCALWSTNADHLDPEGTGHAGSLQDIGAELSDEAEHDMRADVDAFLAETDAQALQFWSDHLGDGQIGHDLWLTRNGHGAGFWDRFYGDTEGARFGRILTDAAKPYGEQYLYVGANDLVYVA